MVQKRNQKSTISMKTFSKHKSKIKDQYTSIIIVQKMGFNQTTQVGKYKFALQRNNIVPPGIQAVMTRQENKNQP